MSLRALLAFLLIGFGSSNVAAVRAQGNVPIEDCTLIADNLEANYDISWSGDGQSLYFRRNDFSSAYRYSLESGDLTEVDHFPSTVTLTPEEQEYFGAAGDTAYFSPDGVYLVYLSEFEISHGDCSAEGCGQRHTLALGHRELRYYAPLRIAPFVGFRVRWNSTSTAFVVEQETPYGGMAVLTYVGGFVPPPDAQFFSPVETTVGAIGITVQPFDVSPELPLVLLPSDSESPRGLSLWDGTDLRRYEPGDGTLLPPYPRLLTAETVVGAAFIPGDTGRVLMVSPQGIVRYELETGAVDILNPDINSTWVQRAVFSPDIERIAVVSGDPDSIDRFEPELLYICDWSTASPE